MPAPRDESSSSALRAVDDAAAAWVARQDRGLTPAEQDEFFQWLAIDPRHGERLARHQRAWAELAHLAQWRPEHGAGPNPDLLAPARPRRNSIQGLRWLVPVALATAASLAWLYFIPRPPVSVPAAAQAEPGYRQQVLDDGTRVELNRGTQLAVAFSPAQRHVRLVRGEALFTVARDSARPFVVEAGGVTVRAIGTVFNVRLGAAEVDVVVTEGSVQLDRPAAPLAAPPLVGAGHRAVMPLAGAAPVATPLSPAEIEHALAWQPRLLEFASTPLADVAAEFNRRNRVQLIVADDALRALPIGASFRSDNLDGFVRLLEASFGVSVERHGDTILLRRAR